MNTADILDRAADRMVGRWHQGHYYPQEMRPDGAGDTATFLRAYTDVPCCAEGALQCAVGEGWNGTLTSRLAVQDFLEIDDLVEWNDDKDRTEVEVIAAFRGAAGALRNGTLKERPDPWAVVPTVPFEQEES